MANRGLIRLAYSERIAKWFCTAADRESVKTVSYVDCPMFVQHTADCVSTQTADKKLISYHKGNELIGQVVWVEEEIQFRLMM